MNTVKVLLRKRVVRAGAFEDTALALTNAHSAGAEARGRPIVLQSLDEVAQVTPTISFSGRQLWNSTKLLRENGNVRRSHGACVVGGASAIRRVWRDYKIRPNVVYVPDTEPTVASWCLEDELPTCIVRCSPVEINRGLLSAELADGHAAEFPIPASPSVETFLGEGKPSRLASMLVLVGLRIPSNVGTLIRAAVEMGFESVLLINCLDPFGEKALRASEGTVFSPQFKIFEPGSDPVSALNSIAVEHNLLPLLALPSQKAETAFEVAKNLHKINAMRRSQEAEGDAAASHNHIGPLLILGSEAKGLRDLAGEWSVPRKFVSVPLPNSTVESLNVSVAGSILIHAFRPAAEKHFVELEESARPRTLGDGPLLLR
ncbi:SpoU rRNA Methylase family, putative [Trypanosoma equiperdum]|uniref:tRNA/rRNA methyltransferase SpoU type domain-containing protein n=2 Tax=Trypanozoon TaxID=39700 RepID=Q57TV7_TRYB2|nr:hypothetical protein, conserved [Trypanosoma brucei brucei TREU927]AAX80017.1 hypothetical protein, conserved [Trypanosoma brucei]AAZ13420.1 hypothetical protein, conserved [Trypanosoma brucei brucei TREU927]SCU70954.1 SpoU rRNA Methylase family, putative [Trypanosoma equiperdum]